MGNYPPSTWLKDARWPVTTMADDVNSSAGTLWPPCRRR